MGFRVTFASLLVVVICVNLFGKGLAGVFPNQRQKLDQIQKALKNHKEQQSKYDGSGKRVYKNIDEVMQDVKRPYHPNIGFYEPLKPKPSLNDPRCTRQGMLGCGDRCFTPHTYTRCVNGIVIGSELSFPEW